MWSKVWNWKRQGIQIMAQMLFILNAYGSSDVTYSGGSLVLLSRLILREQVMCPEAETYAALSKRTTVS